MATRPEFDAEQIARADVFTTARFLGRGQYDIRRFQTRDEAETDATGDRRAMIYAVTPEGMSIHLGNGA